MREKLVISFFILNLSSCNFLSETNERQENTSNLEYPESTVLEKTEDNDQLLNPTLNKPQVKTNETKPVSKNSDLDPNLKSTKKNIEKNDKINNSFAKKYGDIDNPSERSEINNETKLASAFKNFDGDLETMKKLIVNPKSNFNERDKYRKTPFQKISLSDASEKKAMNCQSYFLKNSKKGKETQELLNI